MSAVLDWLYRRLGARYFLVHLALEFGSAALVCLGTVGLFSIYQDMSAERFWRIVLFSELFVAAGLVWTTTHAVRASRPVVDWVRAGGGRDGAVAAWHAAVGLPRELVTGPGWKPFVIVAVPISAVVTLEFDLPYYSAAIVFAGSLVAIAYAAILSFFATEILHGPVLRDIARWLPADFAARPAGVPLRWKLLGALPLINVITGVVVSGLSADGRTTLDDLGIDVIVAVGVAFTISLELTLLVTRSLLAPVGALLDATERVGRGDFSARVPVVSGDELGTLASSFNAMARGLDERRRLQEAFGSYVDPDVARRVLAEGTALEGEDVEATVMFVDVRDFTGWAERASAREAVARLNGFFSLVVPIVLRHGGHANKFIGDGLLAVFGTPERHPDHADRAVAAACEIAAEVAGRYGEEFRIGIGINSGPLVAGSIGGGGRLEFTVIGDPVNVASRVEKATREMGETVLLTEATRALLVRETALRPCGEVTLRGRREPVPVYAPGDPSGQGPGEEAIPAFQGSSRVTGEPST